MQISRPSTPPRSTQPRRPSTARSSTSAASSSQSQPQRPSTARSSPTQVNTTPCSFQSIARPSVSTGPVRRVRPQSAPVVPKACKVPQGTHSKRTLTLAPAVCTTKKNRKAEKTQNEVLAARARITSEGLVIGSSADTAADQFWALSSEIAATLTHRHEGSLKNVQVLDPHDEQIDDEIPLASFGRHFYRLPIPSRATDVRVIVDTTQGGSTGKLQLLGAVGGAFMPSPGHADIVAVQVRPGVYHLRYFPEKWERQSKELILGILNSQEPCTYRLRWPIENGAGEKKAIQPGRAFKSKIESVLSELRENPGKREVFMAHCAEIKRRPLSANLERSRRQDYISMNKQSAFDWTAEKQLERLGERSQKHTAEMQEAHARHLLCMEQRQVNLERRDSSSRRALRNILQEREKLKSDWVQVLMVSSFLNALLTAVNHHKTQEKLLAKQNASASKIQFKYFRMKTYVRRRDQVINVVRFRVAVTVLARLSRLSLFIQSGEIIRSVLRNQHMESKGLIKMRQFIQKVQHVQKMWRRVKLKRQARVDILLAVWEKVEEEALEPILVWEKWVLKQASPEDFYERSSEMPVEVKRFVLMRYVRQMQTLHYNARYARQMSHDSAIMDVSSARPGSSFIARPQWEYSGNEKVKFQSSDDGEVQPAVGTLASKYLGFDVRHEELRDIIYHSHNQWRTGVFDDALRHKGIVPLRN
eukprot:gnl/MRDRNA2_/MRDRNA2_98017_c0_seq1.p1 gnl/MRDRNA2_/MRDRNA2_98017_c0~~gnl/MRDRNA2_/MRDRNA2_98017_c0_seq1.p1  ORF type:complete len:702 (-),score=98.64 gnl/MRDRNA2_/MRDRNA2_98017_c0_seq1:10-2115(-)